MLPCPVEFVEERSAVIAPRQRTCDRRSRTEGEEKIRRTRKAERARRRRELCDVHARLHREARLAASGILLAVAQKRIVAQIEAIGPLPRNVEWLHQGRYPASTVSVR